MSSFDLERKNSRDKRKNKQNKSLNKGNIYICKKCFAIPLIQFNYNNREIIINTKCNCGNMENNIFDFENKFILHEITKQYLSNILNSFFYCFNCKYYLCESCINKHEKANKNKHIVINLKLTDFNSKEHMLYEKEKNNILYCLNCNKKICKNCKDYHLNEKHNIIKGNNNCIHNNSYNLNNFYNDFQKLKNNLATQKEKISLQITKIKNMINDIEKEFSKINSKNKSFINIIENIYKSYIFYKDYYNYNIFTNFQNLSSIYSNIDYNTNKITDEKIIKQCKEFLSQIKNNIIISKNDELNDISNISILTSMRESLSSLNKTIENLNNVSNSKIIYNKNKRTKFIKLDKGNLRKCSFDKKTTSHLKTINYELEFEKNFNNNTPKNLNQNVYEQTIEKINNLMTKQKNIETQKKKNLSFSPSKINHYMTKLNINDTSIIKKIKHSQEKKLNKSFLTRSQSPRIKDSLYENKKVPVKTLNKYFKVISKRKNAGSPFSKIIYNIRTDESTRASGGSKDFNLNYSIISNTSQFTEKYINRKKVK